MTTCKLPKVSCYSYVPSGLALFYFIRQATIPAFIGDWLLLIIECPFFQGALQEHVMSIASAWYKYYRHHAPTMLMLCLVDDPQLAIEARSTPGESKSGSDAK
jgi:hypothetical protein